MSDSTLTSKERARLRSLAHPLKPVVQIGSAGVTPALLQSIREAFNTRELLKIRVLEAAPESARAIADAIVAALEDVHAVQTIGRVAVLYRPRPEEAEEGKP